NQKAGDVRSDIYFLGTVLFECVTGEPIMPVTKDRQARMMARRYQEVEATLQKTGPALGVPPPLMTLLAKMLAYDPAKRFQTPSELVEAVQACRMELGRAGGPKPAAQPAGPKTLFAIETRDHLKESFREKLKTRGYRVIISSDPGNALRQFKQQPFHTLIVDAGSVGREGVEAYNKVVREALNAKSELVSVLLLEKTQESWAGDARAHHRGAVLIFPFSMRQLIDTLRSLDGSPAEPGETPKTG
ncbi:MAG TPA: serine/threonine protein kinase, partial [Gemmata sp.]|nr:serine/threonine protein kinase [Gemmata sp.]